MFVLKRDCNDWKSRASANLSHGGAKHGEFDALAETADMQHVQAPGAHTHGDSQGQPSVRRQLCRQFVASSDTALSKTDFLFKIW
jgi:hypothetical protein